jgi:CxxC motif-containing protein (DUF1111 family)
VKRPRVSRSGAVAVMVILVASVLVCRRAPPPEPGGALAGLSPAERALFERGRQEFERVFAPETGLGPSFNAEACAKCHESPVSGGSGDEIETHVAMLSPDGMVCDPLVEFGGPVIQLHFTPALQTALGIDSEPIPRGASMARRTSPDLFGFGLLDAVPDSEILALADPDDRDGDGISGRPNRGVDGRLGRFGRKAFVSSLDEFNAGALTIEMGITSPAIPTEESIGGAALPQGVDPVSEPEVGPGVLEALDAFVRFLAPPAPLRLTESGKRGRVLFSGVGCAACHYPTFETGNNPSPALRYRTVSAYTDLLLHDMGSDFADICLGQASPSEFRTEPLMGLRFLENPEEGEAKFLHDGRARSIEEAILLHAGEATHSRERFQALSEKDRAALLEFLRSL